MSNTFYEANGAFFDDFMKCISTEPDLLEETDETRCLITNDPLEKYSIRLNCGHSFNYLPLLNAIKEYKSDQYTTCKHYDMNTYCPYCREKTSGLLPYAPGFDQLMYINIPHTWSMGNNICKHVLTKKIECGRKCYYHKCHKHVDKPDATQCVGVTRKGEPCKNKATSLEIYCKLHRK